jgi:hypothetical protein
MQKAQLIERISFIKEEMEPLAIKWAKISKKKFESRFDLEGFSVKALNDRYKSLKVIQDTSFADLLKVWRQLPVHQWETTFAQQMRHLDEYKDLRKALVAFKNHFMNKKKPNAEG